MPDLRVAVEPDKAVRPGARADVEESKISTGPGLSDAFDEVREGRRARTDDESEQKRATGRARSRGLAHP